MIKIKFLIEYIDVIKILFHNTITSIKFNGSQALYFEISREVY